MAAIAPKQLDLNETLDSMLTDASDASLARSWPGVASSRRSLRAGCGLDPARVDAQVLVNLVVNGPRAISGRRYGHPRDQEHHV